MRVEKKGPKMYNQIGDVQNSPKAVFFGYNCY